jgi:hypothetical protein
MQKGFNSESGAQVGAFDEKTRGRKSPDTVPLSKKKSTITVHCEEGRRVRSHISSPFSDNFSIHDPVGIFCLNSTCLFSNKAQ